MTVVIRIPVPDDHEDDDKDDDDNDDDDDLALLAVFCFFHCIRHERHTLSNC